ncbi:MAG: DUF4401 domain-containing protein, partial [Sphingobacteriales bacterium]
MEITDQTKTLLSEINAGNNNSLVFDAQAIQNELQADNLTYKGLGIKVLIVVGGLLGSLFFLGAISVLFSRSDQALVILGVLTIAGAVLIDRNNKQLILDTFCISSYLAGYLMLGIGLGQLIKDDNIVTSLILAAACLVMLISNGYMFTFFSVLIGIGCLAAFISINYAYNFIHVLTIVTGGTYTLFNIYEPQFLTAGKGINQRYNAWYNATLLGFTLLLCFMAGKDAGSPYTQYSWISSVIIIAMLLLSLYNIMADMDITLRTRVLIFAATLAITVPVVFAPAVCGAILLLVLSWHTKQRLAQVIAVLTLIYAVGMYYYNLDFTLLAKSGMMFTTGTMFILAWFILKKQLQR